MVRDGLVVVEEKEAEERPAANGSAKANGKSKKAAPTPAPASKARTIVKLVKGTVAPFSEAAQSRRPTRRPRSRRSPFRRGTRRRRSTGPRVTSSTSR
jgi:hypothetical protein